MHKSQEFLSSELEQAGERLEIGSQYSHYKDEVKTYFIRGFGIWEPTDQVCVIYQADYGEKLIFVRPLEVFTETVEYNGHQVPRFKKVYQSS